MWTTGAGGPVRPGVGVPAVAGRALELRRRLVRVPVLAAVLAAGLVGIAGAQPASAHDELVSTDPANGATVATAPDQVTLTFTDKAIALGTEVKVTGPDGSVVSSGDLQLGPTTVAQPLAQARPAGTYTVVWRVTSADGHPVSGTFTFVASAGVGGPTPTSTPTPTAAAAPSATSSAVPRTAAPSTTATPSAAPAGTSSGMRAYWPMLVVVLVLAAGAASLARRRMRGPGGEPGAAADPDGPGRPQP